MSGSSAPGVNPYSGLSEIGSYPDGTTANTWAYFITNTTASTIKIDIYAYALCAKI